MYKAERFFLLHNWNICILFSHSCLFLAISCYLKGEQFSKHLNNLQWEGKSFRILNNVYVYGSDLRLWFTKQFSEVSNMFQLSKIHKIDE